MDSLGSTSPLFAPLWSSYYLGKMIRSRDSVLVCNLYGRGGAHDDEFAAIVLSDEPYKFPLAQTLLPGASHCGFRRHLNGVSVTGTDQS